jgi:putative transposase
MLYKNKYRIESARLKNWDYSTEGCYFVTICTQGRNHYFGGIDNGAMMLSEIGKITEQFWGEIPNHFPFVHLDEWVIMPNHVHGIIVIDKTMATQPVESVETPNLGVSTTAMAATTKMTPNLGNGVVQTPNLGVSTDWKPGNIGVIINQYKRICTIQSRKTNPKFAWQPRFHDHIIRNHDELIRIRKYIVNNPMNWDNDDLQCKNGNLVGSISEHIAKEKQ